MSAYCTVALFIAATIHVTMFLTDTTTKLNVKDFTNGRPCHSLVVGGGRACSDLPGLWGRCCGQPVEWRQPGPSRPISQDQATSRPPYIGGGVLEMHARAEVHGLALGARELDAGVVGRRRGR